MPRRADRLFLIINRAVCSWEQRPPGHRPPGASRRLSSCLFRARVSRYFTCRRADGGEPAFLFPFSAREGNVVTSAGLNREKLGSARGPGPEAWRGVSSLAKMDFRRCTTDACRVLAAAPGASNQPRALRNGTRGASAGSYAALCRRVSPTYVRRFGESCFSVGSIIRSRACRKIVDRSNR